MAGVTGASPAKEQVMDRRRFMQWGGAATGAVLAGCGSNTSTAESTPPARTINKPLKMHVGTQRSPTTPELLQYFKRHGVDHICGYPPDPGERGYWLPEDVAKTRELCEQHGVALDMVALPLLPSSHIDREKRGAIMLGQSPERDRDIEHIHRMIEACAKAGVPAFKYNMSLLGVLRTEPTPGRGGSSYSTWKLAEAKPDPPLTRAGEVNAEQAWERISYFVEKVIPVAHEYKIRAACHPHDPGVPPEGYQGVVRVLGTPEGLYQFMALSDSPFHGFNLCLGTTSEMLQDPNREIHDVIRRIGSKQRIFNIHFRNIRGKRDDFVEVYPDEGDLNMVEVAMTLAEVDYPYMLMPDHMPRHEDDPNGRQAFAFGFGYIKAVLQAIETLA
jgi:mannonate dehydratase